MTSKACPNCKDGRLHNDVRDVTITRQSHSAIVQGIVGEFCDRCDEIEFDPATDSAERYAETGDRLVLKSPNDKTRSAMEEARAMAKARSARFASADALIDDLEKSRQQ